MKTFKLFVLGVLLIGFFTNCKKDDIGGENNQLVDIDGNVYKTVKIGEQVWTAENLKVTQYNDGTPIPYVQDFEKWSELTTGALCWYDHSQNNSNQYGALYNIHAVNTDKLAPEGWHVATRDDWDILMEFLTSEGYDYRNFARALKSTTGWKDGGNGQDIYGFSALPAGFRQSLEDSGYQYAPGFVKIGEYGAWWLRGSGKKKFSMGSGAQSLSENPVEGTQGNSIRLVKNFN